MKLAVQEQMIDADSLERKFEWAVANGWDGIELRGRPDFDLERRLPELSKAAANGVVMPTVCVEMPHFIGAFDDDLRADAVANLVSQLTVAAEIGALGVMTPAAWGMFSYRLPPFVPPRTPEQDRAVLLESFTTLAAHAQKVGVEIWLEPLNRYEDHMINRLEQAASLIDEIGIPSFRIIADTYHMNIEEADPLSSLRRHAPYLGHIQVSDSNRLEPGAGHVDFAAVIATLDEVGYDRWYAIESRFSATAEESLPASAAFLRRAAGSR
jgi:sugar phosphate isomerase/epimerase